MKHKFMGSFTQNKMMETQEVSLQAPQKGGLNLKSQMHNLTNANSTTDVSSLDLSQLDIDSLIHMYQDEKLAMDVYSVLAEEYGSYIFDRISDAEERHLSVVEDTLVSNGINIDDLQSLNTGEFVEEGLQSLYDSLIEEGLTSYNDALNVGVQIEEFDIVDLQNLESNIDVNATLVGIYTNLESASFNHLYAFENSLSIA